VSRITLGDVLAHRVQSLRGKDAVIVCLQESSLLTCLTMARRLRAWVYPLIYEPVYTPDAAHRLLGAYDQDGDFCPNPGSPTSEAEPETDAHEISEKQRTKALKSVRDRVAAYGMELNKHQLDGRHAILAADVLTSPLPIVVAQRFLADVSPRSLTAVVGNATAQAAQLVRLSAAQTEILDVLSGIAFDDNHYFEQPDAYSVAEKHTLTQHIATYWQ